MNNQSKATEEGASAAMLESYNSFKHVSTWLRSDKEGRVYMPHKNYQLPPCVIENSYYMGIQLVKRESKYTTNRSSMCMYELAKSNDDWKLYKHPRFRDSK